MYQDHLTRIGGKNRFGKPNFILAWGQTRAMKIYGQMEGGSRGQHIVLEFGGIPAWHILEWKPPETFGTPRMWYAITWDPEAMVHGLGDYPWRGQYVPCTFNLYVKRIERNVLKIDAMPLAFWVLDLLIPNVRKAKEMTHLQKKLAIEQRIKAEKYQAMKLAYDAYLDAQPAFGGKAGTYESNREAWMQRVLEKQAGMRISAQEIRKFLGRGHTQVRSGIRRK